jgi:hypothetical protein
MIIVFRYIPSVINTQIMQKLYCVVLSCVLVPRTLGTIM